MSGLPERDAVAAGAAYLRERLGPAVTGADLAIVLGSGLRQLADAIEQPTAVGYADVPHWPAPRVEGHGGVLVTGRMGTCRVACLSGRVHLYEGYTGAEVVRAVRTLRQCGVATFLLTNAAGGIGDHLSVGDLMLVRDHLNLTGRTPLLGPHVPEFGPRFPDQTSVYDVRIRQALRAQDGNLQEGVYAGLLGPSYETPAEVLMLSRLGADAVGMSTVHEAIALHAMGARVAAISVISNLAAGIADTPLSHGEVMAAGLQAQARLAVLVAGLCARGCA